jgi:hypothetical protein
MIHTRRLSGGFLTLIALMIAVMIGIFFAAKQYQQMAERNHDPIDRQSAVDAAWGAKTQLEIRDRENLNTY